MMRADAAALAGALLAASAAAAAALPPAVSVGGERLQRVSCGVREILWVDVYRAALYLRAGAPPDAALDADEPAALRVEVESPRHFPYRMPEKWRRALGTGLDDAAMERVDEAYQRLGAGDRLAIEYRPGNGASLYRNGTPVAHAPGHGVIAALLEAWAEDEPAADKVRRIVLQRPC